ncbi:MAG: hypothetical protein JWQ29_1837 [Phenylobacterium sp.]|jgi:hypothetical protein|nr:hypothetical protein [Phenylobacterium sp.]
MADPLETETPKLPEKRYRQRRREILIVLVAVAIAVVWGLLLRD